MKRHDFKLTTLLLTMALIFAGCTSDNPGAAEAPETGKEQNVNPYRMDVSSRTPINGPTVHSTERIADVASLVVESDQAVAVLDQHSKLP